MKPYHIFTEEEFDDKSQAELKELLTGRVMTCSHCCASRVCLHAWMEQGSQYFSISCGGTYGGDGCKHNIAGTTLSGILNEWNAEIDEELEEFGVEALDFATEIAII